MFFPPAICWLYGPQPTMKWSLLISWGFSGPGLILRLLAESPRPLQLHTTVSPLVTFSISFNHFPHPLAIGRHVQTVYVCVFMVPSAISNMHLPHPHHRVTSVPGDKSHKHTLSTLLLLHFNTQTTKWASLYLFLISISLSLALSLSISVSVSIPRFDFITNLFYSDPCKSS